MSQLYKEKHEGEYRGNAAYYMGKRSNCRTLGIVYGIIFIIAEAMTQNCLQANACAQALDSAFGIPLWVTAIVMAAFLAYLAFGGSKRIGRFAEVVVPIMAAAYIIVALIILFMNLAQVPAAFLWRLWKQWLRLRKATNRQLQTLKKSNLSALKLILFFLPLRVQICFYTVTVEQICFIEVVCLMKHKAEL